jgi:hypothetical protein
MIADGQLQIIDHLFFFSSGNLAPAWKKQSGKNGSRSNRRLSYYNR